MRIRYATLHLVFGAMALAVVALSHAPLAMAHGAQEHAAPASADYKRSVTSYAVPDVTLIDYDDRPVKLRQLLASQDPVLLNFVFTTCGSICPIMTKVFSDVPEVWGKESRQLRMISISIDPEADTPLQLKAYARSFGAGERWKFLTGRVEDVKAVQRAFGAYRGDKMSHEPLTLMRQASGKDWIRIDGFASPDALGREFRKVMSQ